MNTTAYATRFTLVLCSALLALALPVLASSGRDDAENMPQVPEPDIQQWSRTLADQLIDDDDAIGRLTRVWALRLASPNGAGFFSRKNSEWQLAAQRAVDAAVAEQHLGALHLLVPLIDSKDADPQLQAQLLHALQTIDPGNLAVVLYRLRDWWGAIDDDELDSALQAGATTTHHDMHAAATVALVIERASRVAPPSSLLDFVEAHTGVRDPRFAAMIPMNGLASAFGSPEFTTLSTHCRDAVGQRRDNCLAIARILSLHSSDAISRTDGFMLWRPLAAAGGEAAEAEQAWRDMRWQIAADADLSAAERDLGELSDAKLASTFNVITREQLDARLCGIEESARIRQRLLDAGVSLSAPAGWSPPQ